MHLQFPDILKCALKIYQSVQRRSETTAKATGVSLKARNHQMRNITPSKEHKISLDTAHQLIIVPRKNTIRQCYCQI